MANSIQVADISPEQFVTATSRYNTSTVLYYTDLARITFATYKRQPFVASSQDLFMVIPIGFAYRPDLISQRVYGFPDYWWKIMEANKIFDIYDFKAGLNIRVPSTNSLTV